MLMSEDAGFEVLEVKMVEVDMLVIDALEQPVTVEIEEIVVVERLEDDMLDIMDDVEDGDVVEIDEDEVEELMDMVKDELDETQSEVVFLTDEIEVMDFMEEIDEDLVVIFVSVVVETLTHLVVIDEWGQLVDEMQLAD